MTAFADTVGPESLALIELDSVARGLAVLDALVKRAEVSVLEANLVEPGKFLILFAGGVAEVEESWDAALERGEEGVLAKMKLAYAHPELLGALRGPSARKCALELDALGVIEGTTVAPVLEAADRSLKEAEITLAGLALTGGLGGRAYYVVYGAQHDVEAAIEAGSRVLSAAGALHRTERIARPHEDMVGWLLRSPPFRLS